MAIRTLTLTLLLTLSQIIVNCTLYIVNCLIRPVGQAVKTAASHAANRSSILLRVTKTIDNGQLTIKRTSFLFANAKSSASSRFPISLVHATLSIVHYQLSIVSSVGTDSSEGTPVPIPNTEVKLAYAENTWSATTRENR